MRLLASAAASFRRSSLPATGFAIVLGATLVAAAAIAWLWLARAPSDRSIAQAAADPRLEEPALIVLPFGNLSGAAGDDRFAGLHHIPESLIDQFMDGLRKAGLGDGGCEVAAVADGEPSQVSYGSPGNIHLKM